MVSADWGYPILTDAKCRAAKAQERAYKLSDAHGLYLFVSPSGHKSWRWKYRVAGKEKTLTIGSYPEVTLAQARSARESAAKEHRDGLDPSRVKKQQMETTFEAVARIWHGTKAKVWSKHHWRNVLNTFENEAFPIVGHLPITKVRQAHVLQVLDPMQDRGAIDQAHRLRQRMSDVFLYAISKGMAEDDPAAMVRKALSPVVKRNYPALTVIEDARKLLRKDAEKLGWPTTKLASRLLALTAARSEALRFSEPHEFEGLDGPEPIWRIPAAKMKLRALEREKVELEFVIPLSRQAVEVVQAAMRLSSPGPYVFPTARHPHSPMGEAALAMRYRSMGYGGIHVPHGWRTTFSTIMNERAERIWRAAGHTNASPDRLIIDLMLAHEQDGVEPIYNRAAYMERRRELAQEWADLLCQELMPIPEMLRLPRN
jgi:hypothetical protein